jgi:FkbM family methyltransferase
VPLLDLAVNSLRPFSFRGKGRLLNSFCPKEGIRRTSLFGYSVELDVADHIQRNVYLGTYERHESALVRKYLRPGMTFVDIGANIGYYSLMAAAVAGPLGRVIAFEPNPVLNTQLKRTVDHNGIRNITVEQLALAEKPGSGLLFVPKESGNNTATMIANDGGRPIAVSVLTLDEYLEHHQIGHVNFMKMDVEGFEPKIIQGALLSIRAKKIDAILCEFCGEWLRRNGTTPIDFYKFMRSLGLRPAEELSEDSLEVENILFTAS